MSTATYVIGATAELTVKFTNAAGVAADPATIALKITEPDGAEIDKIKADMTNPVVGTWIYNHPVTKAGRHFTHWDAGGLEAATQPDFYGLRKTGKA